MTETATKTIEYPLERPQMSLWATRGLIDWALTQAGVPTVDDDDNLLSLTFRLEYFRHAFEERA